MIIGTISCVFIDGKHAYAGVDCPHERTSDELGEIKPEGWTAQNL